MAGFHYLPTMKPPVFKNHNDSIIKLISIANRFVVLCYNQRLPPRPQSITCSLGGCCILGGLSTSRKCTPKPCTKRKRPHIPPVPPTPLLAPRQAHPKTRLYLYFVLKYIKIINIPPSVSKILYIKIRLFPLLFFILMYEVHELAIVERVGVGAHYFQLAEEIRFLEHLIKARIVPQLIFELFAQCGFGA